jgi:hypothetical protein
MFCLETQVHQTEQTILNYYAFSFLAPVAEIITQQAQARYYQQNTSISDTFLNAQAMAEYCQTLIVLAFFCLVIEWSVAIWRLAQR